MDQLHALRCFHAQHARIVYAPRDAMAAIAEGHGHVAQDISLLEGRL